MSLKTETENIKTSGAEKVLAGVLTVFILIGAVWAYGQIGKISEDRYTNDYGGVPNWVAAQDLAPADRVALKRLGRVRDQVWDANRAVNARTKDVEFARETYRTEIDAGRSAPVELTEYRAAQAALAAAERDQRRAKAAAVAARPAAAIAQANRRQAEADRDQLRRGDDRVVFGLRLALLAVMLAGGYLGLSAVRRRRSRLLPLALAEITAAALFAAYMAIDYGSSFVVFREMGPLAISLIGIALTIATFIALQRYLAKRIPIRRVRKRECPFCGFPAHGNPQCEGCGRRLVGECSTCHEPRRVATPHCGQCGAA